MAGVVLDFKEMATLSHRKTAGCRCQRLYEADREE
jgi:hypothetical protein